MAEALAVVLEDVAKECYNTIKYDKHYEKYISLVCHS